MSRYSFRDTGLAEGRLALLAETFEPEMRVLLATLPKRPVRLALDLGCGPGFTTRLLMDVVQPRRAVGVDISRNYVRSARTRFPDLEFVEHNVTQTPFPVRRPDFIMARLVLAHLPDPESILAKWAGELTLRGLVAVAEVETIETVQPVFSTYLSVVERLIADGGGELYLGPRLHGAADPTELRRLSSEVCRLSVSTGAAASMFSMNLAVWRTDRFVVANYDESFLDRLATRLEQLRRSASRDRIEWGVRHLVYERSG
ncbi:MAG: class I SAM-dependent methyltransferase [Candidatus Aminicenantes bacterium]|nr:class I SAM-dependent methyltransferase [Candidatus Aminicenantes bacterium]